MSTEHNKWLHFRRINVELKMVKRSDQLQDFFFSNLWKRWVEKHNKVRVHTRMIRRSDEHRHLCVTWKSLLKGAETKSPQIGLKFFSQELKVGQECVYNCASRTPAGFVCVCVCKTIHQLNFEFTSLNLVTNKVALFNRRIICLLG